MSAYLNVAAAADCFRVSPSTLRRWIRSGRLKATRLGPRMIAIKLEDIAAANPAAAAKFA